MEKNDTLSCLVFGSSVFQVKRQFQTPLGKTKIKVIAAMCDKNAGDEFETPANLNSAANPERSSLNQRHINTFEIQEKAKAKSNRVLSYAIDYASADNLPACINRLNQNSKPW